MESLLSLGRCVSIEIHDSTDSNIDVSAPNIVFLFSIFFRERFLIELLFLRKMQDGSWRKERRSGK